jgi:hypothetical protein
MGISIATMKTVHNFLLKLVKGKIRTFVVRDICRCCYPVERKKIDKTLRGIGE